MVAWVGGQWHLVAEAEFDHDQVTVFVWQAERAGGDTKTRNLGGRWRWPGGACWCCENTGFDSRKTGSSPGRCGPS